MNLQRHESNAGIRLLLIHMWFILEFVSTFSCPCSISDVLHRSSQNEARWNEKTGWNIHLRSINQLWLKTNSESSTLLQFFTFPNIFRSGAVKFYSSRLSWWPWCWHPCCLATTTIEIQGSETYSSSYPLHNACRIHLNATKQTKDIISMKCVVSVSRQL